MESLALVNKCMCCRLAIWHNASVIYLQMSMNVLLTMEAVIIHAGMK